MKKKILVVLTGGTIGSKIESGVINVSSISPYRLISMYEELYGREEASFEVIHPINILSENMTPDTLLILLKTLNNIPYDSYAGMIITHGSDTLSYTSAFVGLLFHHFPIPVILVADNYPLGQEGSSGLNNFAEAVKFIRQRAVRGVFTLYKDGAGINQVYLATRIVEAEPFHDQFRDFSGEAFGRMENGKFVVSGGDIQPAREEVEANDRKEIGVPESFTNRILLIRPYPGLDYSCFQFNGTGRPAAILHCLYHSATACTTGEEYNLLSFVEKCRKQSIDVYTASYKRIEGNQYATGKALLQAGVTPLMNMSPEAAYAKLLLLYNNHGCYGEMRAAVCRNYYFESVRVD